MPFSFFGTQNTQARSHQHFNCRCCYHFVFVVITFDVCFVFAFASKQLTKSINQQIFQLTNFSSRVGSSAKCIHAYGVLNKCLLCCWSIGKHLIILMYASWWCNMLLNWLSSTFVFFTLCSSISFVVSLFDWSLYLRIKLQNKLKHQNTHKHTSDVEPLIEMPVGCTLISLHSSHSNEIKSEHFVKWNKNIDFSRIKRLTVIGNVSKGNKYIHIFLHWKRVKNSM